MNRFAALSGGTGTRELSRELRESEGEFLQNRRRATALGMVSVGAMAVIALYQMGVIRHLPEPPLPGLDADEVDASGKSYRMLRMPDAVLGMNSYSTTLALAAMGGADRARTAPWIPLALAGKALVDAAQAGRLTWRQWSDHRAFCSYCLLAAGATFAVVPLVIPEARAAWKELMD